MADFNSILVDVYAVVSWAMARELRGRCLGRVVRLWLCQVGVVGVYMRLTEVTSLSRLGRASALMHDLNILY